MRQSLSVPVVGSKITKDWGKNVAVEQRANRILPGIGYRLRSSQNGVRLEFDKWVGHESLEESPRHFWKVRWMSHDPKDPSKGEWQVYVPPDACQVKYDSYAGEYSYPAEVINEKGVDEEGNELVGWYKISDISEGNAYGTWNNRYGAGLEWSITARIGPWGDVEVSGKIRELVDYDYYNTEFLLVEPIAIISEIKSTDSHQTTTVHLVEQTRKDVIEKRIDISGPFSIFYLKNGNSKEAKIGNQSMVLGRSQIEKGELTSINKDTREVWIKVKHENEEYSFEVVFEDPGGSNDNQTCIKIYELRNYLVVYDGRPYLPELPFYTNSSE